MKASRKYVYKIVLCGEPGVGKSSLIIRYVHNRFQKDMSVTLGINVYTKQIQFGSSGQDLVTLSLFDIGGQDRFQDFRHNFFKGTRGAALVYDVTRPKTLEKLNAWWNQLRTSEHNKPIVTVLVGNKTDLVDYVAIPEKEGRAFGKYIGSLKHFRTSAKTAQNVNEMFKQLAKGIMSQEKRKCKEAALRNG
ncbi:MAG: Rab family GTPase [Candidatus Heimdallarchaeota archaeon]